MRQAMTSEFQTSPLSFFDAAGKYRKSSLLLRDDGAGRSQVLITTGSQFFARSTVWFKSARDSRQPVLHDEPRLVTCTQKIAHLFKGKSFHLDHRLEFLRTRPGVEPIKDILHLGAVALRIARARAYPLAGLTRPVLASESSKLLVEPKGLGRMTTMLVSARSRLP